MMRVTLNYFGQLRQIAGRDTDVSDCNGQTGLRELLGQLAERYGKDFGSVILDEDGRVRPSLLVLVNGQAIGRTEPPPLADGDEVTLLPPIAGG